MEMPALSPDEQVRREVAAQVEQAAQEQPETVAALLRAWMSETEE
jgi:flagellar biosynthesis/type III secretory pathway M-ring protein FliF/YscJ